MTSINIEVTPEFVQAVAAALAQIVNANGSANTAPAPQQAVPNDPWATTPGAPTDQQFAAPSAPVAAPFVPTSAPVAVAPPMATQAPQGEQSNVVHVNAPSGPQTWTLNAPNAPACHCNPPARAAYVKGTTSKGRPYAAWRCAKAAGSNWKSKCEFNDWA